MTIDNEQDEEGREQQDEQLIEEETDEQAKKGDRRGSVGEITNRIPRSCRNLTQAGMPLDRHPRDTGGVRNVVPAEISPIMVAPDWQYSILLA